MPVCICVLIVAVVHLSINMLMRRFKMQLLWYNETQQNPGIHKGGFVWQVYECLLAMPLSMSSILIIFLLSDSPQTYARQG
jgi:hypothetical protein